MMSFCLCMKYHIYAHDVFVFVFVLADDLGWNQVHWHNSELGYDVFFFVFVP